MRGTPANVECFLFAIPCVFHWGIHARVCKLFYTLNQHRFHTHWTLELVRMWLQHMGSIVYLGTHPCCCANVFAIYLTKSMDHPNVSFNIILVDQDIFFTVWSTCWQPKLSKSLRVFPSMKNSKPWPERRELSRMHACAAFAGNAATWCEPCSIWRASFAFLGHQWAINLVLKVLTTRPSLRGYVSEGNSRTTLEWQCLNEVKVSTLWISRILDTDIEPRFH